MSEKKDNPIFPQIKRSIEDFLNDEEGNIPRGKLLSIGALLVLFSAILSMDAYAKHSSHSSHKSHSSHSSTSYHRSHTSHASHTSSSHSNHASHSDHGSHSSHGSHTSHSNTSSHSNSNYSAAGDLDVTAAPRASAIKGIGSGATSTPAVEYPAGNAAASSGSSPTLETLPGLAQPLDTPEALIDPTGEMHVPPDTPDVFNQDS